MRRSLIALLLLFSLSARAQVGDQLATLAVGVSGGGTASFVEFSPHIKQNAQPGFTGGFVLRYTSEQYFSMFCATQLEVNYIQRGWNELIEDGSYNTFSCTTSYIEVPFMAHLSWGKRDRGSQFFFNAGPCIAWNIGKTEHYGFTEEHPWNVSNRPNRVVYQYGKPIDNPFEYGIAAGLGTELKTTAGNYTIEARYFYGLSDMYSNRKADVFGRSANNTITLKVAALFDIIRR